MPYQNIRLTDGEVRLNLNSQGGKSAGGGYSGDDFYNSPGYLAAVKRTSENSGSGGVGGVGSIGGIGGTSGVGNIEQITQLVNEINQRAQQSANAGRIPGGGDLEKQSSENIGRALRGEMDPSSINRIGQAMAERGASTGSPMAPANNAAYVSALYNSSEQLRNTGQNWLTQAVGRNPAAPIYDAGNQVLTAGQIQQAILAREQMANQILIAQMQQARSRGGGGGGYGGGSPTVSRAATPSTPTGGSNYPDLFPSGGGSGGWSFPPGYWEIPRPDGPPMGMPGGQPFPWGTEGATGTTVDASTNFSSDMADFEDWFYRDDGG